MSAHAETSVSDAGADDAKAPPAAAESPEQLGIFRFNLEFNVDGPLPTLDDGARLRGRFRHFNTHPIAFVRGAAGALNLGLRLYRAGEARPVFEDRMAADAGPIAPDTWINVAARIPLSAVSFAEQFRVVADLVKENEYWFSSRGGQPLMATEISFIDTRPAAAPSKTPPPAPAPPHASPRTAASDRQPRFAFAPAAADSVTIYDVVMAFEVLLGRNPESASVIDLKLSEGFPKMIGGILGSNEFREKVVVPIRLNRPVKRADSHARPSEAQISWLLTFISLDEDQQKSLREAGTWSEFFTHLLVAGGTDVGQQIAQGAAAASMAIDPLTPALAGDGRSAAGRSSNISNLLVRLESFRDLLGDIEKALRAGQ